MSNLLVPVDVIAELQTNLNSTIRHFQGLPPNRWETMSKEEKDESIATTKKILEIVLNNNSNLTPKKLHEMWVETKQNEGWTYGPIQDNQKRQHPCLVPWEKLNWLDKLKDFVYLAVIYAVLEYSNCNLGETCV